jgi:hypothetical protein
VRSDRMKNASDPKIFFIILIGDFLPLCAMRLNAFEK